MDEYSKWIWCNDWNEHYANAATMVLFRKKIEFEAEPKEVVITVSADSRYKLYINQTFVEVGPSKGDSQIWYQDNIDITSYLKKGSNVIAIMVLRYPLKPTDGNQSIIRTNYPGLYVIGMGKDVDNNNYEFSADGTWKYMVHDGIKIVPEAAGFAPLQIYEEVREQESSWDWKAEDYIDSDWRAAVPYHKSQIRDAVSPGNLNPRTIPFMYKKKRYFKGIINLKQSKSDLEIWNQMLHGKEKIVIPPWSEEIVEIDAGEETTGYYRLFIENGNSSEFTILQSEAYVQNDRIAEGNLPVKEDRMDYINGHLEGYQDLYYPAGRGTDTRLECYEPFWFRTFRFIQLKIVTKDSPVIIHGFDYIETGYPLNIETKVNTSDESLQDIWEISERTLQRCMHETYEDCPFYEQLQYAMDSRAQILYTYASAADDRLARKCIDDFKRAQRYDGLISSAYPNTKPNVIPGFSIFYIMMLHDHMMYFGDKDLISYHMPSIENVLYFFEQKKAEQRYLGQVGGYHRQHKFWSFIDWTPEWKIGVPNAINQGPITMESLLYILGLQKAAELADYIGRKEQALKYQEEAVSVQDSIRKYCIGADGMVQDGPGVYEYSQHCQVFAVITNTIDIQKGKENLLKTIEQQERYAQCSVSMILYLFRALEMTGLYDYTDQYWNVWRKMIQNHMTTSAESNSYCRSECHAWGAVALYELPAIILGVRPATPGFEKVYIRPITGYLEYADGYVITPKGKIEVSWKKKENEIQLDYKAPEGIEVVL
ncbi:alpha-L-rhamnosidase-related protein [Anaeromicropila herbilytica]|uniref:Alpha-L-rhamnosidase n=1 Tax=Anaeromicropila herbilytica TaxID=2785025 RepID=A0A7R7ICU7_9FIRM|nr:alpha-L-rhamnosidase C-terminal domain-containing protein [Anaeromicropila herbilytica]BCN31128.1 hypothetical protein bsdtb5_24230 [Anaeromicropila herbilytica]